MRDKKMLLSMVLTITVMLFAGGCGQQTVPVSAEPTETAKEVGTEDSMENSEVEDKEADPAQTAQPTKSASPAQTAQPTKSAPPAQTAQPANTAPPVQTAQPAQTTQPAQTAQPAKTAQPAQNTQPAQTAQTVKPVGSTPTPQPAHTHSWKEHTATKQVWIPNIVIIPEYEDTVVGHVDTVFICDCGYETTDRDDYEDHTKSNVIAGNEGHGGSTIRPGYDIIERVQVGYHEEDRGHYETQTYVDYYYCECGETKN